MINYLNYKLKFADGKDWIFSYSEELKPLLNNFAEILGLEKTEASNSEYKIIINEYNNENKKTEYNKDDYIEIKQGKSARVVINKKTPEFLVEINKEYIDHPEIKVINMWSLVRPISLFYCSNNGGPIHATFAELNGKGILIAASGGVGKSTCYERLPDYWKPLSDDMALLLKDKDKQIVGHPLPTWSDHLWLRKHSTFNSSYSVPLKAIFFLKQAEIDKVTPLSKGEACQGIYQSLKQPLESFFTKIRPVDKKMYFSHMFNNAANISMQIPAYNLDATLDGKFWEEIEKVI
ncbi:MAG: SynChlorMet cassette protein ScmC [Pseudomonadota bacterium]